MSLSRWLIFSKSLYIDENLNELEDVLHALSAPDIKTLAKSYHIPAAISQKSQLVEQLVLKSKQSNLSKMLGSQSSGVATAMLKK